MRIAGRTFAVPVILALTIATAAHADRPATEKRGFNGESALLVSGIDTVSLFTGSLVVKLDLGPTYIVSPTLSYSLSLVYSSTAGWDQRTCPEGTFMPDPDDNNTGGFKWAILLGQVSKVGTHWRYDGPDGGRHGLYPWLHPGAPATAGVFYSNDATYMRLRYFASGGTCESPAGVTGECLTLELPSRVVHEFRKVRAGDEVYRLTRMRDLHGNYVAVSYTDTSWQLTDSLGRTQTLEFGGPAGEYNRVNRVRLSSFGGGEDVYVLRYENRVVERQDFDPAACSLDTDNKVTVPVLTRLVRPDGGSFYEMDYYTSSSAPEFLSGGLKSLRLPTGGEYRWTYEKQSYQSQDPGADRFDRDVTTVWPVVRKEVALTAGGPAVGTWEYRYERSPDSVPGDVAVPCHRSTTVRDPEGNETRHFFSTSNALHLWSYGLSFTRCAPGAGYSATGPFLSSEVYEGTVDSGTKLRSVFVEYESDGHGFVGNGEVNQEKNHRLVYRKTVYHDDGDRFQEMSASDFTGMGDFRVRSEDGDLTAQDSRTITTDYDPDRGTLVVDPETGDTTGSTFVLPALTDPWVPGLYTTRQVTAAGATATTESCFDETTGFLERTRVLAGTSRAAHDLLTVYEPERVGGQSTGRVAVEKLHGGDDQASMDNVYGTLCEMTLPAQPKYQTVHTYSAGALATSAAVDPCDGAAVLSLVDRTIDASTGLVAADRDAAGVETAFTYDSLGRIASERPAFQARLFYVYQLPTETQPNLASRITVTSCPSTATVPCSSAEALTWRRLGYDGLGRQVTEAIRIPGAAGIVENTKTTTYNALGWKTSESAWGNSALVTTFAGHDPFGRVGTVTPPNQSPTGFTYEGVRVKTRQTWVMTASNAEEPAFTTEIYDAHGRLTQVCENQSSAWTGTCTGIETTYLYDVGSRLTRVCSNRVGGVCGQTRRFLYDNRGFLTQERHPEIGITEIAGFQGATLVDPDGLVEVEAADVGNDWIFYTRDAKGNVLTKDVEGSTEFDLTYRYDSVGRLIRIDETNGGSPRPLKELYYARSNAGNDLRAGKLVQTKRHNWVDIVTPILTANSGLLDAIVTEVFKYEDPAGRASARQTRFTFSGATYAFTLSQTYDELGHVATLTYPQCAHAQGDCPSAAPVRTVEYDYTKGFLTEVVGFAPKLSYQAGGMLHQIEHANGVVYTVAINPADGLERPYRISTTAGWDTGTYLYDGTGNVHQIGSQKFRYDRMNRLVSGQVQVGASLRTQTANYDVYGNITSLTTNGVVQSTPTDATSNRMQAPLASYDGAGNVTSLVFGSERYEYEYDGVNMMKHLRSNTDLARIFLYTADDERIAQFDCVTDVCETQGSTETWTLRGLDNKVLRTYVHPWNEGWQWKDDFVYGNGRLLTVLKPTVSGESAWHAHLDHLGTPRQVTDTTGSEQSVHSYYPFGREATTSINDDITLKFTGHERDANGTGDNGKLDYLHARYCSPEIGRFTSLDPKNIAIHQAPQTWNKYLYAANNPLTFIDPDGKELRIGLGPPQKALEATRLAIDPAVRGALQLGTNRAGQTIITIDNSARSADVNFKNIQRTINSPGIVELNLVSPTQNFTIIRRSTGKPVSVNLSQAGLKGVTIPSAGTLTKNEGAISTEKGINQVFITNDRVTVEQAPIVAAEIGAHALPALLGKGAAVVSLQEHSQREEPLKEAARANSAMN